MSSSASEEKARQRRLRNVTRQVIAKAFFQRIKDELRAEERRKVREERQRQEERQREAEQRTWQEARQREVVELCAFFLSVLFFFLIMRSFLFNETKL